MTVLTAFLCRCIWQRSLGPDTSKMLGNFIQNSQKKYSMDSAVPWTLPRASLHKISISLVTIALSECFDSAKHQKEFLKCLVDNKFGNDFSGMTLFFLYTPFQFSVFSQPLQRFRNFPTMTVLDSWFILVQ